MGSGVVGPLGGTVVDFGWSAITNGELLRGTWDRFDALVTMASNLEFPHSLVTQSFGVVVGMDEGEYQRVACPDLAAAVSSGPPLESIPLGRLPDDFEPPLWARVDADDEEGAHLFTLVRLDETSGEAELVGPIHPSTSPEGGEVRILVTDGTLGCRPFDFTVEALQPAPGELTAIADHLQGILEEQAAVLGTSTDQIMATPLEELPPALYPLALLCNSGLLR